MAQCVAGLSLRATVVQRRNGVGRKNKNPSGEKHLNLLLFVSEQMGRIQCPLLVVIGEDDHNWPVTESAEDVSPEHDVNTGLGPEVLGGGS